MTTSRPNGSLYLHTQNKIATIEFGHPSSNSFPSELLERLRKAIEEVSQNESAHVVILKSEGDRAFCAGASFDELVNITDLAEGKRFFSGFANVINAMRKCSKPIIGRVQGISRKIGLSAFETLAWDASQWKNAYCAKEKGLYTKVFEKITELDKEIEQLASNLASYNSAALQALKKINWKGTDHWDQLLIERSAISGELVLSKHTKEALSKFKKA